MRKLILRNRQSPGDVVTLTAAVRDLHAAYPDTFLTDVRTPCAEIWEGNPLVAPLDENDPEVTVLECEYPLVHQSNQRPYHFIHAFRMFLEDALDLAIPMGPFRGDIRLRDEEKTWMSQVAEAKGFGTRFWIVVAGGKYDYTAKWWPVERFQAVVDAFADDVLFVQVGAAEHHHPQLRGVLDLRGKTDMRQLIRLVYHADGVLCPVTLLMHLAAAVEPRPDRPGLRPCVVVAGGREAAHWEAYPGHQFLHTIGALPCCATGGCWRSRTMPLGDGDEKDSPENLCVDVRDGVQHCMNLITPEQVERAIRLYYDGGRIPAEERAETAEDPHGTVGAGCLAVQPIDPELVSRIRSRGRDANN